MPIHKGIDRNNLYLNYIRNEEIPNIYSIKLDENVIHSSNDGGIQSTILNFKETNINDKNSIIIYDLENNNYKFNEMIELEINCNKISIIKNKKEIEKNGIWKFLIDINDG